MTGHKAVADLGSVRHLQKNGTLGNYERKATTELTNAEKKNGALAACASLQSPPPTPTKASNRRDRRLDQLDVPNVGANLDSDRGSKHDDDRDYGDFDETDSQIIDDYDLDESVISYSQNDLNLEPLDIVTSTRCACLLKNAGHAAQKIAEETGRPLTYIWEKAGFTSSPPSIQDRVIDISTLAGKRLYVADHLRGEISM